MRQQPDEGTFVIAAGDLTWSGVGFVKDDKITWKMYAHRRSAIRAAKKLSSKYGDMKLTIVNGETSKTVWPDEEARKEAVQEEKDAILLASIPVH